MALTPSDEHHAGEPLAGRESGPMPPSDLDVHPRAHGAELLRLSELALQLAEAAMRLHDALYEQALAAPEPPRSLSDLLNQEEAS